jgi:predicted RNA polymerase sigma factor
MIMMFAGPGATLENRLVLLFLRCHPALSPSSQLALTLRAVGGLTTVEVASAFLVPEAAMAKRIMRAKQRIRVAGAGFELPSERAGERAAARECYLRAAVRTSNLPEQRYLELRAARLGQPARPRDAAG